MVSFKKKLVRPFVMMSVAMTADGKIATADRAFSRFGSAADHAHLLKIRGKSDAILAGASTLRSESATLHHPSKPYRILVTGRGTFSDDEPLFLSEGGAILVLTTSSISTKRRRQYDAKCSGLHQSEGRVIDWKSALEWLRNDWGIRRILVEGGGKLNQSLFLDRLVDELYITVCPVIIGGKKAPTLADGKAFPNLDECSKWFLEKRKVQGDECFLKYRSVKNISSS